MAVDNEMLAKRRAEMRRALGLDEEEENLSEPMQERTPVSTQDDYVNERREQMRRAIGLEAEVAEPTTAEREIEKPKTITEEQKSQLQTVLPKAMADRQPTVSTEPSFQKRDEGLIPIEPPRDKQKVLPTLAKAAEAGLGQAATGLSYIPLFLASSLGDIARSKNPDLEMRKEFNKFIDGAYNDFVVKPLEKQTASFQKQTEDIRKEVYREDTPKALEYLSMGVETTFAMVPTILSTLLTGGATTPGNIALTTKSYIPGLTIGGIEKFNSSMKNMLPFMMTAGGNTALELKDRGYDAKTQLVMGTIAGFTEGLTEMIPFEMATDIFKTAAKAGKTTIKQGIVNGTKAYGTVLLDWVKMYGTNVVEENAADILNSISEKVILDSTIPITGQGGILDWERFKDTTIGATAMATVMGGLGLPMSMRGARIANNAVKAGRAINLYEQTVIMKDTVQQAYEQSGIELTAEEKQSVKDKGLAFLNDFYDKYSVGEEYNGVTLNARQRQEIGSLHREIGELYQTDQILKNKQTPDIQEGNRIMDAQERAVTEPVTEQVDKVTEQVDIVDKVTPVTEQVAEPVVEPSVDSGTVETKPESVGYHAGDLGKSEHFGRFFGSSRDTGHFGTGTYFVGNKEKLNLGNYKTRPMQEVDLSSYNLAKPKNASEAQTLHDMLKYVNNYLKYAEKKPLDSDEIRDISFSEPDVIFAELSKYEAFDEELFEQEAGVTIQEVIEKKLWSGEIGRALDSQIKNFSNFNRILSRAEQYRETFNENVQRILNVSPEKANEILTNIKTEMDIKLKGKDSYSLGELDKADSLSTQFMKALGYEGVDVRHISEFDNTGYGTVVYDLKTTSPKTQNKELIRKVYTKIAKENFDGQEQGVAVSLKEIQKRSNLDQQTFIDTISEMQREVTTEYELGTARNQALAMDINGQKRSSITFYDTQTQQQIKTEQAEVAQALRKAVAQVEEAKSGFNVNLQKFADKWLKRQENVIKQLEKKKVNKSTIEAVKAMIEKENLIPELKKQFRKDLIAERAKVRKTEQDRAAVRVEKAREQGKKKLDELRQKQKEKAQTQKEKEKFVKEKNKLVKAVKVVRQKKLDVAHKKAANDIINMFEKGTSKLDPEKKLSLDNAIAFYEKELQSYDGLEDYFGFEEAVIFSLQATQKLKELNNTKIGNLSKEDMLSLRQVLRDISSMYSTMRSEKYKAWKTRIDRARETVKKEIDAPVLGDDVKKTNTLKNIIKTFYGTRALTPRLMALRMSGYKHSSMFYDYFYTQLNEGQRLSLKVSQIIEEYLEKETAGVRLSETKQKYDLESGQTLEITPEQKISLYLHSLSEYNVESMKKGVRVPGKVVNYILTEKDIDKIVKDVSVSEKKIATAVYNMFNSLLPPMINEVSIEDRGYELAVVDDYYPIVTPAMFKDAKAELFDNNYAQSTIRNWGHFRPRSNRHGAIVLEDVSNSINRAKYYVSRYIGYTESIRDAKAIIYSDTVKAAITKKFGEMDYKYFTQLIHDIDNMNIPQSETSRMLSGAMRNMQRAILGLNVWVAAKQVASLPLALSTFDIQDVATLGINALGTPKQIGELHKKQSEYSPIYYHRGRGRVTMESGALNEKKSGISFDLDKSTQLITTFDRVVLDLLWKAAENETRRTRPDLKYDTKEFWEVVARRAEQEVQRSQPNFDLMQRSELGRSKSLIEQLVVMFSSQRNITYNLLYEAVATLKAGQGKEASGIGTKTNTDIMLRTVAGVVSGAVMIGIITNIQRRIRKKEEEPLINEIISTIIGNAYLANDIHGMLTKNYSISNVLYSSFEKVFSDTKKLYEVVFTDKEPTANTTKHMLNLLSSIATLSGIPLTNAINIIDDTLGIADAETQQVWRNLFLVEKIHPAAAKLGTEIRDLEKIKEEDRTVAQTRKLNQLKDISKQLTSLYNSRQRSNKENIDGYNKRIKNLLDKAGDTMK